MVRFGVIGAGRIAKTFSEAMKVTKGYLYAIASRDILKARKYQKAYGYEKVYDNYEEMLKDDNIDCVYIATPHGLHFEHMMLALKYHKNILCEKSFTLNAKQALTVFNKAKENHLFIMEAMWTRFLPTIKEVKHRIDQSIIGEITMLEAHFGFSMKFNRKDRLVNPNLGGGALLDLGVYPIHFAHLFLGSPLSFETKSHLDPIGIDLSEQYTFQYHNAIAILSSSLEKQLDKVALIKGTKGYIKIYDFWKAEKAQIFDLDHHLIEEISYPHLKNGFEYEINEVIRCLEENLTESPLMPYQTTLFVMKQMDELRHVWGLKYPGED
ncbi:MAG: Gfo/Idh/MocA family oxidoreductase [Acholeplasmataceae bacterium]|nr:Gfo/Idh/MocA family oxidoreductase [Acholeplasmataceae bacterium]